MRTLLALLLTTTSVLAADLKAPAGYPTGTGWYIGLGAEAEVASSTVATTNFGTSLYSAGASIDLRGGYQFRIGSNWGAIEFGTDYTNLGNTVTCSPGVACGVGSTWSFDQGVMFGFPWTAVISYLPNLSIIFGTQPIPPGATATSSLPYASFFVHEKDVSASINATAGSAWIIQPALGLGTLNALPNGVVLDTRVEYAFSNTGFAFGPNSASVAKPGSSVEARAVFKF